MDVLVMLEEAPQYSAVLAQVNSVPSPRATERPSRDIVTLYGVPSAESLALALAAALESRKSADSGGNRSDAVRHLGVWPGRGAVGDAAWRDRTTGQMVTRDLEIPLALLSDTARVILTDCGQAIRRVLAGLLMPDWPEGTRRALTFSFGPVFAGLGVPTEALLDSQREADGVTFESEDN